MSTQIHAELRWVLPDGPRARFQERVLESPGEYRVPIRNAYPPPGTRYQSVACFMPTGQTWRMDGTDVHVYECDVIRDIH